MVLKVTFKTHLAQKTLSGPETLLRARAPSDVQTRLFRGAFRTHTYTHTHTLIQTSKQVKRNLVLKLLKRMPNLMIHALEMSSQTVVLTDFKKLGKRVFLPLGDNRLSATKSPHSKRPAAVP